MKPVNVGGHSAYQNRVLTQIHKYYPEKDNPRLFNNPPRDSAEWKLEYNARTSAECGNKLEKIDCIVEVNRLIIGFKFCFDQPGKSDLCSEFFYQKKSCIGG